MKPSMPASLLSLCIAGAVLSFWFFSSCAADCEIRTWVRDATPDDIRSFFDNQNKRVVTFVGYSGAGYEHEPAMLDEAGRVLDEFEPSRTIVNIGATPEGIGAVYALARQRGFTTTGIVSTRAREYGAVLSRCVDYVFYVDDASWGGFVEATERLSPTSAVMVNASDVLIGIGGGEVGRDELIAATRKGKEVHFIPADMNHRRAREVAQRKGLPAPRDFRGAAGRYFRP